LRSSGVSDAASLLAAAERTLGGLDGRLDPAKVLPEWIAADEPAPARR
jgi:hypothetical protein